MDATNCKQGLLREKQRITEIITKNGASVAKFEINEDGYVVRIKLNEEDLPKAVVCALMDQIDFIDCLVSDFHYYDNGMEATLVPITQEAMNNFVWSYVEEYLDEMNQIEALMTAVGVLESMIESMPDSIQQEYQTYVSMVIQ